VLEKKFTELSTVPSKLKMSIFGPGSLIGAEDVVNRSKYSSTLRCTSWKGRLYKIRKEDF